MSDQDRPAPRLVELSPADAERIKTFEETVWFEHTPGLSAQEWVEGFDFTAGKGVEVDEPPPPGSPAGATRPLVGLYGAFAMAVTVPGPGAGLTQVPMSGLSWVGVHPDHRRRGVLRQMMTDHLHGLHDAGRVAVAGLWAAEVGIYGRFGYAVSALELGFELAKGAELSIPEPIRMAARDVSTHLVPAATPEAAAVRHTVHVAATGETPGSVPVVSSSAASTTATCPRPGAPRSRCRCWSPARARNPPGMPCCGAPPTGMTATTRRVSSRSSS